MVYGLGDEGTPVPSILIRAGCSRGGRNGSPFPLYRTPLTPHEMPSFILQSLTIHQKIPIWHLSPDRKSPTGRPIIGGYNDILCGKIQVAVERRMMDSEDVHQHYSGTRRSRTYRDMLQSALQLHIKCPAEDLRCQCQCSLPVPSDWRRHQRCQRHEVCGENIK